MCDDDVLGEVCDGDRELCECDEHERRREEYFWEACEAEVCACTRCDHPDPEDCAELQCPCCHEAGCFGERP
jgi:hypothetical protein